MELLDLARLLINTPYKLYAMVLSNQKGFLESFCANAHEIPSLEIVLPVCLEEIIPQSTQYDIGLIPFKPTTFNLAHCMPNKLFEYVQARLAIVSTPLYDVGNFIRAHSCGVIAKGFESAHIADVFSCLSYKDIDSYKISAHKAAQKWHLGENLKVLKQLLCDSMDD